METKVPWYPFSLPDYLMPCLIAWLVFWVNPVVSITSLNFVCCSPADLIQMCKHFHNAGLHLHIMCSSMNASAVFKDKHCIFSKPLCPWVSSGWTPRASPVIAFILFLQSLCCEEQARYERGAHFPNKIKPSPGFVLQSSLYLPY